MPRVKICGLTSVVDALHAAHSGADALGFILYEKSPRYVALEKAAEIVTQLPPFASTVAVTVNSIPLLQEAAKDSSHPLRRFTVWQLHGAETPAECASLAAAHIPLVKIIPGGQAERETLARYEEAGVRAFLLDTPSEKFGGTGQTFAWSNVSRFQSLTKLPVILSGGLNPDNLAKALDSVHVYAVDVASGVELSPGVKDPDKVLKFIQICKKS